MIKNKTSLALELNKSPRRSKRSGFWASQLLVAALGLIFLGLISVPLLKNYAKQRAIAKEVAELKSEISDFESKNKDLSEMLNYLESNDSLEEQARLNLGLKKPGEKVIVINETKTASATDSKAATTVSNFIKWWHYFFKT